MATKYSPDTVLTDANKIIETWTTNPDFALGTVKLEDFKKQRDALVTADGTVEAKRTELSGLMGQRDDEAAALNDLVTRARSGFRASYGADSPQYKQAGGTRASERKSPRRAAPAPEPAPQPSALPTIAQGALSGKL